MSHFAFEHKKSLAALHLSVMLFGLSAVLGQMIEAPAVLVAGGRVFCSSILLAILQAVTHTPWKLHSRKDAAILCSAGIILALHWTAFFQSIQASSVAIGTITFSTFPLFLTVLEPLIFHEKLQLQNIGCAVMLLAGVAITVPEWSLDNPITAGIGWGMLASLTYAVMTLLNRVVAGKYPARTICLYEQGTAAVVLFPAWFILPFAWTPQNLAGIALLGFACTALAHSLYIAAQKNVRAQTAGIISGLETVYGILYALIFLQEIPAARELAGGAVILAAAMFATLHPACTPSKSSS